MSGRRRAALAGALLAITVAALTAAIWGGAARTATGAGRLEQLGRSVQGRAIRARHRGDPAAPRKVLVVGSIHGDEPAGLRIVRALRRAHPPAGVELVLVDTFNPDGIAHHTRQNARGVDLNRNFPNHWRRQGRRGSRHYSGRRPLSEPESRLAHDLIVRLHPDLTVWYHQPLGLVDLASGPDRGLVHRYARLSGLPARRLPNYPGSASRWQNHFLPRSSAFVVELRAGRLSQAAARRHARALLRVAAGLSQPLAP